MVVSSHVLDEVERFGSRVLVMVQGRLAAEGDFRAIRDLMDDRPHRVRIRTDRARAVATGLLDGRGGDGRRARRPTTAWSSRPPGAPASATRWPGWRQAAGATLIEIMPLDDDLESVFRYLVGR